jgi:hypothetical protein
VTGIMMLMMNGAPDSICSLSHRERGGVSG